MSSPVLTLEQFRRYLIDRVLNVTLEKFEVSVEDVYDFYTSHAITRRLVATTATMPVEVASVEASIVDEDERFRILQKERKKLKRAAHQLKDCADTLQWLLGIRVPLGRNSVSPLGGQRTLENLAEASEVLRKIVPLLEPLHDEFKRGEGRPKEWRHREFRKDWAAFAEEATNGRTVLDEVGAAVFNLIWDTDMNPETFAALRKREGRTSRHRNHSTKKTGKHDGNKTRGRR